NGRGAHLVGRLGDLANRLLAASVQAACLQVLAGAALELGLHLLLGLEDRLVLLTEVALFLGDAPGVRTTRASGRSSSSSSLALSLGLRDSLDGVSLSL